MDEMTLFLLPVVCGLVLLILILSIREEYGTLFFSFTDVIHKLGPLLLIGFGICIGINLLFGWLTSLWIDSFFIFILIDILAPFFFGNYIDKYLTKRLSSIHKSPSSWFVASIILSFMLTGLFTYVAFTSSTYL
jgi:hypothetical protein